MNRSLLLTCEVYSIIYLNIIHGETEYDYEGCWDNKTPPEVGAVERIHHAMKKRGRLKRILKWIKN